LEDDILQENEDRLQKDLIRLAPLGADRQRELIEEHYLLHQAAGKNSLRNLTLLLSANPDTNAKDLHGRPALHMAAASRHENAAEIITALIRHGADVNMRDACQWLPLHRAVESRVAENALRLIDAGAEVNAIVPKVGAPIHLALNAFQDSPPTAVAMISRLLSARADPNSRDYHGNTPLHRVCQVQSQIAQCLLEAGADPNAQDHEGRTPLHIAVIHAEYFLAERLYHAGGDPTAVDQYGSTPETLAADHEYSEVFEALFKASRIVHKPKPRLVYQPARPFEPDPRRRELCLKFRGSFWYIKSLVNAGGKRKLSKDDDYRKPSTSCSLLAELDDESFTLEDVASCQVTRATPTVYDMLYGDALLNGFKDTSSGLKWVHLPFTIVCHALLQLFADSNV
jgi:ankyrin repeat protein